MKMLPFDEYNFKTPRILEELSNASRYLAELKGFANSIPNQHILINAITINEAKDSSAIENIVTTYCLDIVIPMVFQKTDIKCKAL